VQGREYFLKAKYLHVQFTTGRRLVPCSVLQKWNALSAGVKIERLIIRMFHGVPCVPRVKMERFAMSRPAKSLPF
jgi:hypothetical protein